MQEAPIKMLKVPDKRISRTFIIWLIINSVVAVQSNVKEPQTKDIKTTQPRC